jgi:serine protease Do
VSQLEPGGAAARAGIKPGDVILAVGGSPITHAEELPRKVGRNAPGATVDLTIIRDKQQREVKATLDTLPDDPTPASARQGMPGAAPQVDERADKLGIQVENVPGGGVRVEEIQSDNVRDLAPGDVIVELNGAPVKDVAGLHAAMAKVNPGSTALLKVRRGKTILFAAVPVPAK